ncbi:ATP-binding protein [Thiothrix sp.]|jgi:hypothetical protein|uniref:ATP-binding protein n=1 Tax=Thiothrix sp. TaxID=1032 RepID=UPI0025807D33|nr:ATP-binding protein [Thiothrix sp.]
MAVSSGGSAALNGFLYQILNQLSLIADIHSDIKINISKTKLILEPCNGGDTQYESEDFYRVEQYKARTTGKAWSLTEIIEKVLPDLRLAAENSFYTSRKSCFYFITNGRTSDTSSLFSLKCNLNKASSENFNPSILTSNTSDNNLLHIKNEKDFFEHIKIKTRRKNSRTDEKENLIIKHLISNFYIQENINQETLDINIANFIRLFQNNKGDEDTIIKQLIGDLIRITSRGSADITARSLLLRNNLNPDRLIRINHLAQLSSEITLKKIEKHFNYDAQFDVKHRTPDFKDNNVLLISGESGSGKTWQLCKLVTKLTTNKEIVVFETSFGDIYSKVASVIWKECLGETSARHLEDLAVFYRELVPNSLGTWLTIAIDDIRDIQLAQELILKDWKKFGIRLILTTPTFISDQLQESFITREVATKFSIDELKFFLKKKNKSWSELPFDLRHILTNPILAKLYTEIPHSNFIKHPNVEYEIFEKFWIEKLIKKGYHGDEAIIRNLAGKFIDASTYPFSYEVWLSAGLTDESLVRLESNGWLKRATDSEVAFSHDRLLNWAVAKYLSYRFIKREISEDQLLAIILPDLSKSTMSSNKDRLGYVMLDFIWILLKKNYDISILSNITRQLEKTYNYHGCGDTLYDKLIPTLGNEAKYLLHQRIKDVITDQNSENREHKITLLGRGLAALAIQDHIDMQDIVSELIYSPLKNNQKAAIEVLQKKSYKHLNNRVWFLYKERDLQKTGSCYDFLQASELYSCLKLIAENDLDWVERILLSEQSQIVHKLALILADLENVDAERIWTNCKARLVEVLLPINACGLLNCIRSFSDTSLLSYVIGCLPIKENGVGSTAFEVLSHLSPIDALENMHHISDFELLLTRKTWLPILIIDDPEKLRQLLYQRSNCDLISSLFNEFPSELNDNLVDLMLREVKYRTQLYLKGEIDSPPNIGNIIKCLSNINNLLLTKLIKKYISTGLGFILENAVYCMEEKISSNTYRGAEGNIIKEVMEFLIISQYTGIDSIVEFGMNLSNSSEYTQWFPMSCNKKSIALLAQDKLYRQKTSEQESYIDDSLLLTVFSILNNHEVLIKTLHKNCCKYPIYNVLDWKDNTLPMDKHLTSEFLEKLQTKNLTDDDYICLFAIAALSSDRDFLKPIHAQLSFLNIDSNAAKLACIALYYLLDDSQECLLFAETLLSSHKNRYWAINLLLRFKERSCRILLSHINKHLTTQNKYWGPDEYRILQFLSSFEEYRDFAISISVKICIDKNTEIDSPYIYLAAQSGSSEIHDLVMLQAFFEHEIAPVNVSNAFYALFFFSPNETSQAAKKALLQYDSIQFKICQFLLEKFPATAGEILITTALNTDKASLLATIGRTLRLVEITTIESTLSLLMKSQVPKERKTAIYLIGWLQGEHFNIELRSMLPGKFDEETRCCIARSIHRKKKEKYILELKTLFLNSTWMEKWSLLLKIIRLGDPILLTTHGDPLFIGDIFDASENKIFAYYAFESLGKKKMKKEVINDE